MSIVKQQFHVQKRLINGANSRLLRSENRVLANLYGLHLPSEALSLEKKEIASFLSEAEGGLVYLVFEDSKPIPALVDEVARHPVSGEIQHVAFRRVNLRESVVSEVPIELVGENDVPNTTVVLVVDTVEIESLPTDIPDALHVDTSTLTTAGQSITFAQLGLPTGVSLTIDADRVDDPVVLLQEFKEEVEEQPVDEVVAETGVGETTSVDAQPTDASAS